MGSLSPNYFKGSFDGQGHVVKNLKLTASCEYVGFFGYIGTGGVVKNLGIDNMNLNLSTGDNPNTVGGFASYVQGATITNCYLKNSIVRSAGKQASNGIGVFAGLVRSGSTIKNCYAYKIETLAHLNNVNTGFAHQRIEGGSTFENCYVAEINALWGRPAYSFGSDNQSNVTPVNCWSTLEAITGGNYNAGYAFGNYVADKDTLVSKFKNVEGFAVSAKVNDGYPCFVREVDCVIKSVADNGTVRVIKNVDTPATVYVATYDGGGRMVDVKASPVSTVDFTFTPDGLTKSENLKVFVWDGNNTPVADMYTN